MKYATIIFSIAISPVIGCANTAEEQMGEYHDPVITPTPPPAGLEVNPAQPQPERPRPVE